VFSVTELTRLIKATLESQVGSVWVEGEVSNLRQPSSGHYYFTVKDANAQITAVLFRGNQQRLKFKPRDGLLVRVQGEISVYERSGNYQIIVRTMEEAGQGALQAKFEALKEKLQKEGLFDPARKRAIPLLPQHVGVVTSPTGAAIHDILNVISRRFPNLHLVLAPVKVQGEGAAHEIVAAIEYLNRRGGFDVLIVGRGGGSLEDLWCFNEESVARAIVASQIPVISAVGHEIDFTISDFVADLRAATPSAAAELVVGRKDAFEGALDEMSRRLMRALRDYGAALRNRLQVAAGSYVFREPRNLVRQYYQHLDSLKLRIHHVVKGGASEGHQRLDDFGVRMIHELKLRTQSSAQEIRRLDSQLKALNPLAVLTRGYSITRDEQGRIVRTIKDVTVGRRITTRVGQGTIESEVKAKHDDKEN